MSNVHYEATTKSSLSNLVKSMNEGLSMYSYKQSNHNEVKYTQCSNKATTKSTLKKQVKSILKGDNGNLSKHVKTKHESVKHSPRLILMYKLLLTT